MHYLQIMVVLAAMILLVSLLVHHGKKSQRYKGKKVTAIIANVIRLGGQGKWGDVPHPANEGIEKQNATLLAKWILSGAPQN